MKFLDKIMNWFGYEPIESVKEVTEKEMITKFSKEHIIYHSEDYYEGFNIDTQFDVFIMADNSLNIYKTSKADNFELIISGYFYNKVLELIRNANDKDIAKNLDKIYALLKLSQEPNEKLNTLNYIGHTETVKDEFNYLLDSDKTD